MLVVAAIHLTKAGFWTHGSIMTGDPAVVAKVFLSCNLISLTDVSPSEVFALGQPMSSLTQWTAEGGSPGSQHQGVIRDIIISTTTGIMGVSHERGESSTDESFSVRTLLLFGSLIMSPNIGCVSMGAFFSMKSAMSVIVTSLAFASVISSATSSYFCRRLKGSLATTFFRLSGFSILLRYLISFNVFLRAVKRAEKDCNAGPSSTFIAGPLVTHST